VNQSSRTDPPGCLVRAPTRRTHCARAPICVRSSNYPYGEAIDIPNVIYRMSTAATLILSLIPLTTVTGLAQEGADSPTLAATRISGRPTVDGVLNEDFWNRVPPISGFLQRDPVDGAPASERTEVRVAFDPDGLYFGFVFHDRRPDLIRRNILHRGGRIDKDDRVIIAIDTYHDRRNAYIFEVGALGTQDDALISDESMTLDDWNWDGVFESETRITEEGWVLEVAIPFTTIRFADVPEPTMGIAFMRSIRRKNETVTWPHIGQEYRSGISQVSRYATLTGLIGLRKARHVEIKPYAIAGAQSSEGDAVTGKRDAGLDVKYALTSNLTLDLTLNTDFAQVEADNVQINLTRFDLFFPEKREFFLERAGLFQFGAPRETELFFSRRVGLESDILGGGRLTGQVGAVSMGAMSLRTEPRDGGEGGAWNSVARLRADPMPRTTVGGIETSRDAGGGHRGGDGAARRGQHHRLRAVDHVARNGLRQGSGSDRRRFRASL